MQTEVVVVLALVLIVGCGVSAVVGLLVATALSKKSSSTGSVGGDGGDGGDGGGGGEWKTALATHFTSYPACCKDSPVYDPKADKTECDDNSGCKYMGKFAAVSGVKPFDWVKTNNIAAMFELGQTPSSWASKFKNKRVMVRDPKSGKTVTADVLDRCDDGDCDNCCTTNAKQGGGTLVDLEWHTASRLWGGKPRDTAQVQWKFV